jgi:hypothetical protein
MSILFFKLFFIVYLASREHTLKKSIKTGFWPARCGAAKSTGVLAKWAEHLEIAARSAPDRLQGGLRK